MDFGENLHTRLDIAIGPWPDLEADPLHINPGALDVHLISFEDVPDLSRGRNRTAAEQGKESIR